MRSLPEPLADAPRLQRPHRRHVRHHAALGHGVPRRKPHAPAPGGQAGSISGAPANIRRCRCGSKPLFARRASAGPSTISSPAPNATGWPPKTPRCWARTRHFLFLSGYFNLKLTGHLRDAVASQVGYVPFDGKRQQWAGPRDLKWKLFCVKREMLPELVPAGQSIGRVARGGSP